MKKIVLEIPDQYVGKMKDLAEVLRLMNSNKLKAKQIYIDTPHGTVHHSVEELKRWLNLEPRDNWSASDKKEYRLMAFVRNFIQKPPEKESEIAKKFRLRRERSAKKAVKLAAQQQAAQAGSSSAQ